MFGGVSTLSLDSKGRLAIPARHREIVLSALGPTLVITLESPDHLLLYPETNWRSVEERLIALPTGNPALKAYQRLVLGHAETLDMDAAGRILIPARLRERVSLGKDVALVGMGNRFELWNVADWDRLTDDTLAMDRDALNAALGDFSL